MSVALDQILHLTQPRPACALVLVVSLLFVSGCGGSAEPTPGPAVGPKNAEGPDMAPLSGGVQEGELALTLGEPVRAIRILRAVPENDNSHAYAQELLSAAYQDVDDVVAAWLAEIDTLVSNGHIRSARSRCNYLLTRFPLEGDNQALVKDRRMTIDLKIKEATDELLEIEKEARDLLLANDLESALETLRRKRALAWEIDQDRALKWEQMIAATHAHFLAAIEDGSMSRVATASKHRRVFRRRKAPTVAESPPEEPPPPDPKILQAQELLLKGREARVKKDFFAAIKTYEAVLKLTPDSNEATSALKALDPERKKLVEQFLTKANQYFLRQDLRGAVPYFEKVLVLQPDQKRALEGIRMYENLEKIRGGKKKN